MKVITKKLFSLCDDFGEHEELYDKLSEGTGCDCYIDYMAFSKEYFETSEFDEDLVSIRLFELGAEEEESVLIHIDY